VALQIQNLRTTKQKLMECDVMTFDNPNKSFTWFTQSIHVTRFRHIVNLNIEFTHPITAIAGVNRSGKTSLLLLMACSHENFLRPDATSSSIGIREHGWNDVLSFTSHETINADYQYGMEWRHAARIFQGTGKRLHTSRAWSGIGKKSSDNKRSNAKIRGREVRFIDLERLLPARAFSDSLLRKANTAAATPLSQDIAQAFSYIFDTPVTSISEAGWHLNRRCFVIERPGVVYSTYNAATGEEAVIYLLKDLIESPKNSLILIEEIEAGIHPSVLRKVLDIVHIVSWIDKKQIIFTTHSPTAFSAVDAKSRRFIESVNDQWRCSSGISMQAASSKMDSVAHPLVQLYCEDDLAQFLITKQILAITESESHAQRLINVIPSGPIDQVKNDYTRHQRNFKHLRAKLGFCAVFDGDYKNDSAYSNFHENDNEFSVFIYPYDKPEKFLVRAYLSTNPNGNLEAALSHIDHHTLFSTMVELGLAADANDARNRCFEAFSNSPEYQKHSEDLQALIKRAIAHFTALPD